MQSAIILLGACGFSYLLNIFLIRYSRNFGVQSRQGQNIVRWASTRKPTTGGFSFYITFLVGAIFVVVSHPETLASPNKMLALLLSASLAFIIGLADDAFGINPRLKFGGQLACGAILLAFGVRIHFFEIWPLDAMLTLFWVAGLMNSLNMLDNMDGVTSTTALSILAVTMAKVILDEGTSTLFFMLTAISGGFIGFLFVNWKPARVYMGDTGSMFIGLTLAFFGIVYFWNIETSPDNISYIRRGLIPLIAFLIPIIDTTFVTFSRLFRGVSPFQGGKDHLTHHLAHVGIPESLVPVLLGMASIISGGISLMAFLLIPEWTSQYSLWFSLYPLGMFIFFFFLYKRGEGMGKVKDLMAKREAQRKEREEKVEN
jgi:UDP-GlcNAc:undecaprenyl-phosphate GlcNAc-1-phosphate transferase